MVTRILSSLIGFPILAAVIVIGGVPMKLATMALSLIGMHEFYASLSKQYKPVHLVGYFYTVVYYLMLDYFETEYLMVLFALFMITLLIFMVCNFHKASIQDCLVTYFGFFYVALLLSFIYMVRSHNLGIYIVWLIFICAWGCDTFAYFTGITFGKHKLAPELSPKKTVEGSIGGTVGAALIALIYGLVISRIINTFDDAPIVMFCAVAGCVGAVFSQFGDLAASAIKRYTNIKDYGNLIPGHGGVLDRFDSVLFTAPGVYLVTLVLFT